MLQRSPFSSVALAVFIGFMCLTVSGQVGLPSSRPSQSELVVRVRLPSEQPPSTAVEVQLCALDGVPITQSFTHGDGRADFHDVMEGRYRLRVRGAGYITYESEPFDILHNEHSHAEVAYIVPKPNAEESNSPPTISATDMNVPEKAKAELEKASKAFAAGDADKAILAIRKAIEIFPQYSRAYNNLGVVLVSKGDSKGAMEAFDQSLKINGRFTPAMVNRARLQLKDQDLGGAAETILSALALEPENLEALAIKANVRFFQGDFDDALDAVRRVHNMPHAGFADIHLVAAEVYQKQGKNSEALNECHTFLKEAPKSPRAEQVRKAMAVIEARIPSH